LLCVCLCSVRLESRNALTFLVPRPVHFILSVLFSPGQLRRISYLFVFPRVNIINHGCHISNGGDVQMHVRDIMEKAVFLPRTASIAELSRAMVERSTEAVFITDNHTPIGIVTEKDILKKIVALNRDPKAYLACDIMNAPLITIRPDVHIYEASDLMDRHGVRKLPVLENDQIVGMITATTVSRNYKYVVSKYLGGNTYARPQRLTLNEQ